ncbi:MAG: putative zinc-binding metallopeptidase [Ilumatobacteraceae bacterium]
MRIFHCDRCGAAVSFSAQRCSACGALLAYVSDARAIRVLLETPDPVTYEVAGSAGTVWRCLNTAWGCNWVTPAESGSEWCRSCRLTRGRPDTEHPEAVEAWRVAEAAKRRLLHQLDGLSLPVEPRSASVPDGLAFDLVYLPGEGGITGHLDGVVTLDLAEVDDRHRDDLRRRFDEPFRTVIGHLRHEVGHYFWGRLVARTDDLDAFRRLFGDESADYRTAIEQYYRGATGTWDDSRFVSPYAASHPLEDWAETFAHYLHIVDATDTAIGHGLVPEPDPAVSSQEVGPGIDPLLRVWRPINAALGAIADSLGATALYPFDPTGAVVGKLAFVHRQVAACATREPGRPVA